jgi:hypothetical protein
LLVATLGISLAPAQPQEQNYNGHYEMTDTKANRVFTLDVKQTQDRADVTFSAAMTDGSDAAPDGEGAGRVKDGILSFKFKDSFENAGTCTLQRSTDGYHLVMTVVNIGDPRPLHFYGTILLKKITDQAQ